MGKVKLGECKVLMERDFGFKPSTDLRTGLRKFAEWYKIFYKNQD